MQDLSILLCLLVPLLLVLVDGVCHCGTCQAESYPIYVQYFNSTMSVSIIQDIPSPICNEWSESYGNGSFITDKDNDTSALCSFCGNDVTSCENLDHAFSYLNKTIESQGGLYVYIGVNETKDSSAYSLLHPHTLSGNWGEIEIRGFGDVNIECASGAGLVINEFSTVIIEGTSWKGCGLMTKLGATQFYGALLIFNSYNVSLRDVAFECSRGSSVIISTTGSRSGSWTFQRCYFGPNREVPLPALGGGSVCFYSAEKTANGSLTFINSSFVSNNATTGGAVYVVSYFSTNLIFSECNLTNNTAVEVGGAVFVSLESDLSKMTCKNSVFSRNLAAKKGGALYLNRGEKYFWRENIFSKNFAENGGAVYLTSKQDLHTTHNFSHCNCSENTATTSGGATYSMQIDSQYFSFCHWFQNTADTSAALFVSNVP